MKESATVPSPEDTLIRSATTDDALCLAVLGMQVFLDTYATEGVRRQLAREVLSLFSVESFVEVLSQASTHVVVAERSRHLVGFAQVTFDVAQRLVPHGKQGELFRLYVQEPFTGQGLGTRLLRAAEHAAAARGTNVLWLTPWVHNRRALAFYAARGYADFGETLYRFEGEEHKNRVLAKHLEPTNAA